jgi:hypothetical protein
MTLAVLSMTGLQLEKFEARIPKFRLRIFIPKQQSHAWLRYGKLFPRPDTGLPLGAVL